MKLHDALLNSGKEQLQRIAAWHGLVDEAHPLRADLLQALQKHLASEEVIKKALPRLRAGEREALERLVAEGGRMPAHLFLREYGNEPDRRRRYSYGPFDASLASPAATLQDAGLVYRLYQSSGSWEGLMYVIPDDIRERLPRVSKRAFADILAPVAAPAHVAENGDILRDIASYLYYLQRENVKPVQGNRLSKRDVTRLLQEMTVPPPRVSPRNEAEAGRVFFVRHLTTLLGLSFVGGTRLQPTEKALAWLKLPRQRQYSELWRAFLRDGIWNEWERALPEIVTSYAFLTNTASARLLIAERLKQAGAGRWLSVESLSEALRAHDPLFLRQQRSSGFASEWLYRTVPGPWDVVEGQFIRAVLGESFAWLGLVEVGSDKDGEQVSAFRITAVGAHLLGLSNEPIPEPASQPLIIQANFEVLVPYETPAPVLLQLQQLAELRKHDRVSVYALTRDGLRRALERGAHIENVMRFLEKAGGRPVPQNVAYSLAEWAGRFGEVTIEPATLLTAADEPLLAEIRANKKLGLKVKREITPRIVDVDEDVAELGERLRKAGYLPKLDLSPDQLQGKDKQARISVSVPDLVLLLAAAQVTIRQSGEIFGGKDLLRPVKKLERALTQAGQRAEAALVREELAMQESAGTDDGEAAGTDEA